MDISKDTVIAFHRTIFSWWSINRRNLPWRNTRDPYNILISEVMLQQTQVSRVLLKYQEFLKTFPDVHALAASRPAEVIRIWKGLGYNRRALYLRETAIAVVEKYNGAFPQTIKELRSLLGIGPYTAGAIMVFAYEKDEIMIDTNIRQIITHFFFDDISQSEKIIEETAWKLLPKGRSWDWHQALMDYGALELERVGKIKKSEKKPFKETSRFYRGRIIDTLRIQKTPQHDIISSLMSYGKPPQDIQTIIEKLILDGLVIREKEILSLPE
jgi:A/G-specific adenine glycosylase